jgi:hypothetical protein
LSDVVEIEVRQHRFGVSRGAGPGIGSRLVTSADLRQCASIRLRSVRPSAPSVQASVCAQTRTICVRSRCAAGARAG